ncbi:hypothetical protein [Roseobacter sp. AzwK-3b]|uniref:hypothetical protein n=1 Tax=Roseobacter sp. AzwK-3b TaxID=351016 RepID=UPI0012F4EACF|nr:hypothetical protein [Roseobacter sp. AzwK-3b]
MTETPGGLILPGGSEYKPAYDLRVHHAVYSRGDVLVWLTWNQNTKRPVMILTPKMDKIDQERVIPCIIPLERAWAWAEETGDEDDVMVNAVMFCANLGFNPYNRANPMKIIKIVRDHMGDLLAIPPCPRDHHSVVAEMVVTNNDTGSERHIEVKDHA